jgi:hypothetical protein
MKFDLDFAVGPNYNNFIAGIADNHDVQHLGWAARRRTASIQKVGFMRMMGVRLGNTSSAAMQ